jgi:hypothetical protein
MATSIDFGQAEIQAFNSAVSAGIIHYEEDVARQAVQQYDRMIDGLKKIRKKLHDASDAQGFGGFQTGKELQAGFSKKAQDGMAAVTQLIDGAMRLQEAYLRAGGLIEEADHLNADRLKLLMDPAEAG